MTSSLGHALLGLLARTPGTGYDLTQRMSRPVGYFWSAAHSQIYPELARLESAGLVRHEIIEGAGPRPTKRYELTELGRRELTEWVTSAAEPARERDPLMLRVYSLWLAEPAAATDLINQVRQGHVRRREEYAEMAATLEAGGTDRQGLAEPGFAAYATLRAGLGYEEHRIVWCDWLLDRLRENPGSAN